MQETHLDDVNFISNVWQDTKVVGSFFSNSQRGTLIIMKGPFIINSAISDPEGRFCIANVTHELFNDNTNSLTLLNIYAPNNHKDSLIFFTKIFDQLDSFNSSLPSSANVDILISGDFNFVFDGEVDCQNRMVSSDEKKLSDYVTNQLYERELWDLVQASKESSNFTWRRELIRSRIDYIFASSGIASKVGRFHNKWQLIKTDHAAIIVELLQSDKITAGRSYPKLSFNDIKEKADREHIRNVIIDARSSMLNEWSPHTRLEYVKLMIRSNVLQIRSIRNREISELEDLKTTLNKLECGDKFNVDTISELAQIKEKIDKIENYVEEQLRLKSGVKWREEGERSTKFFLNLIDSKSKGSHSHKGFIDESGSILSESRDITNHARDFYINLYSEKSISVDENFFLNCPELNQEDYDLIGSKISLQELRSTLKTCNDSTPGLDGIPYSFYKIYGDLLLPLVLDSWEYGLSTGTLAPSHRQSCITIIPKAGKDTRFVRNWRPITVASCDLKIVTKALSLRMAKILPSIIFDTQMAYVPGRDISFSNRILSHIIENAENNDDMIISFDAEKAFDSVSHDYLKKLLRKYKFPDSFINSFTTIYRDNSAVVQVNGHLSNSFNINRGVKQGDALSCSLFILAMDPLIRNIENNANIKPITIKSPQTSINIKTLGYADDIAVLTCDVDSVKEIFKEYEKLYYSSGLKLNADKTEILSLNNSLQNPANFSIGYLDANINLLTTDRLKICGNHLTLDPIARYRLNITARIDSLEKILSNWSRRNLTLNGKMMIIKCHALSQLTFVNQFQNLSNNDIRKVESICYKFLWNGGPERVKRSTLKLNKLNGGINGIDIESFLHAAKIRQFFKAEQYCTSLQFIQQSCLRDSFSTSVRTILSKLLKLNWHNIEINDLSDNDKLALANCDLKYFLKPGCKTDLTLRNLDNPTLNGILGYGRALINKICRVLPIMFKHLLHLHLPKGANYPPVRIGHKTTLIHKTSSRQLQELLKTSLKKAIPYSVNSKYEQICVGNQHEQQNWFNLWNIRNPLLRNYRLKTIYKDIYSQERRHRFGLAS